uniref:SWIM-type domain-containing protein n=1 Tax=Steinernema glaseri TaxID=37863 RepID=A0A1I7Y747_9BILA
MFISPLFLDLSRQSALVLLAHSDNAAHGCKANALTARPAKVERAKRRPRGGETVRVNAPACRRRFSCFCLFGRREGSEEVPCRHASLYVVQDPEDHLIQGTCHFVAYG